MHATAITENTPQPITYHAGAITLFVMTMSKVTKNYAKPPKITTPRL